MKWLDTFIFKCVNRARSRDELMPVESASHGRGLKKASSSKTRVASNYDDEQVYNFTIYGANGGQIVEVVTYDEKNDREKVNRYVIADHESLTDSIGKIVMMEFLR